MGRRVNQARAAVRTESPVQRSCDTLRRQLLGFVTKNHPRFGRAGGVWSPRGKGEVDFSGVIRTGPGAPWLPVAFEVKRGSASLVFTKGDGSPLLEHHQRLELLERAEMGHAAGVLIRTETSRARVKTVHWHWLYIDAYVAAVKAALRDGAKSLTQVALDAHGTRCGSMRGVAGAPDWPLAVWSTFSGPIGEVGR